jgi:hypothetical protein
MDEAGGTVHTEPHTPWHGNKVAWPAIISVLPVYYYTKALNLLLLLVKHHHHDTTAAANTRQTTNANNRNNNINNKNNAFATTSPVLYKQFPTLSHSLGRE